MTAKLESLSKIKTSIFFTPLKKGKYFKNGMKNPKIDCKNFSASYFNKTFKQSIWIKKRLSNN